MLDKEFADKLGRLTSVYVQQVKIAVRQYVQQETHKQKLAVPRVTNTMTARQAEIVQLVLAGLPNKIIADRLNITTSTVKFHMSKILPQYGVQDRAELFAKLLGGI